MPTVKRSNSLEAIVEGKEVVYTAESDEVLAKVEKGDCVRCYFGTGGELSYAEIIYDQSANKTYSTDASYESAYRIVSKPVYEVKNNSISLADSETSITDVKNGGETLEKYFVESKSLYIYRFDSEKMKFNQINAGELIGYKQDKTDYDRLILLTQRGNLAGNSGILALYAERMILIMKRVVAYLTMLVMMFSLTSAAFADDDVIKINGEDYTDTKPMAFIDTRDEADGKSIARFQIAGEPTEDGRWAEYTVDLQGGVCDRVGKQQTESECGVVFGF